MTITNTKITRLLHEGIQFWIDYYIQEADPDTIEVIELTKGYKAIVDKDFADLVKSHKWFAATTPASVYAKSSSVIRTVKPQTQVSLHNFIVSHYLHQSIDLTVKHTTFNNKIPLDCRIANLLNGNDRQAVMRNRRGKSSTNSKYKGVRPMAGKFRAFIFDGSTNINLGSWDNERNAAMAYDAAALVIFGSAAHYNFPLGNLEPLYHEVVSNLILRHYNKKLGRTLTKKEINEKGLNLYIHC